MYNFRGGTGHNLLSQQNKNIANASRMVKGYTILNSSEALNNSCFE